MADEDKYKSLLAKERLNIRNAHEVELWAETLDVSTADLVAAVAEVGDSSSAVLAYLLKKRGGGRARES